MDERDLATWWACQFVDAAYGSGLRHAVIAPGSRSTPLTLAFARHPRIQTHVALDERVAAFMTLGLARGTRQAAAVVTTSGTAVANLYPAVLEARASETPLLVLSADRPPMHRGIGASQTLDQIKIFADAPLFFHEVGEPRTGEADVRRLRVLASQALRIAAQGGPVHLNFPFRKPLEPTADFRFPFSVFGGPSSLKTDNRKPTTVIPLPPSRRPILLAGPTHHRSGYGALIADLAVRLDAPIFAEPCAFDGTFLPESHLMPASGSLLTHAEPDLIIRFGHHPVGKGAGTLLSKHIPQVHLFDGQQMQNPEGADLTWIESPANEIDVSIGTPSEDGWMAMWQERKARFMARRGQVLADELRFTDLHTHAEVLKAIGGADLMVSNSFPVRDMDLMWDPALGSSGVTVHANRGVAGIDGVTSTAAGIVAGTGKPVTLVTGDLAFLHDLNALLLNGELAAMLTVVVVNNGGGGIFRMLPLNEAPDIRRRYFETPQQADLAALCAGFGVSHTRVESAADLRQALTLPARSAGIRVIECMTDADASMSIRSALATA
jgi:2-succinyl-5-enolpyruvyl-6-hydroxy-3-cyclohexene-1-carboxylate synthase